MNTNVAIVPQEGDLQSAMAAIDRIIEVSDAGRRPTMPDSPEAYAPRPPLPSYVQHSPEATRAGMLSATAVVMEFETTAKAIEEVGTALREAEKEAQAALDTMQHALKDLAETAQAYRDEARKVFERVQAVTAKASEASAMALELREKIVASSD